MTPLRLAVVGAGLIGRAHVQRIGRSADADLVALVDPALGSQAVANDAGVPLYPDLADMLRRERPDGVILATPNALHVAGAVACLEAGIPVLVEKPVATTSAEAQRLVQAQQRTGVPVLVGHHRRHSAYMQAARRFIDGGGLGRIVAVHCNALFHKPARYFTEAPWRTQPGGGPILINLVHEIDCMRMLAGDVVEVQAMASSALRGHAVEDTAAIVLRFASGALGTFIVSDTAAAPWSWEQTSGENAAYARYADEACYVVSGDRGSLAIPTMLVFGFTGERSWNVAMERQVLATDNADPLDRQMAHFCDVIRGRCTPLVSAAEGARTLQVVEMIARAAATGERQVVADTGATQGWARGHAGTSGPRPATP